MLPQRLLLLLLLLVLLVLLVVLVLLVEPLNTTKHTHTHIPCELVSLRACEGPRWVLSHMSGGINTRLYPKATLLPRSDQVGQLLVAHTIKLAT